MKIKIDQSISYIQVLSIGMAAVLSCIVAFCFLWLLIKSLSDYKGDLKTNKTALLSCGLFFLSSFILTIACSATTYSLYLRAR